MEKNNQLNYFAGIDIGTSGVRCTVIDQHKNIIEESRIDFASLDNPSANDWWNCVVHCLGELSLTTKQALTALSVDGTSGTVVLTDQQGTPLTKPLMYNDARAIKQAQSIAQTAPADSAANGVNTSLARAMWLFSEYRLASSRCYIVHQADYVIGQLTGIYNRSDENNALKLGYDSQNACWESWIYKLGMAQEAFPTVSKPGKLISRISNKIADRLDLNPALNILAGTTDSIAAFNATGVADKGIGVTSLGSTLVVKMIVDAPIVDTKRGVYSHRYYDRWLVGGASNCGAKILRDYFTDQELIELSKQINPKMRLGYQYYPLSNVGERFPVPDPNKQPMLEPRPDEDELFLQGILEALSEIEHTAYQTLYELGAPTLKSIVSVGGGAKNPQWTALRENIIDVPIKMAKNSEASYGVALLSLRHHSS